MDKKESKKLNFAFFGTPDVAAETLEILKEGGYMPSLIITSPDARAGRKMLLTPPPAKIWATENNISYTQPETQEELGSVFATSPQADEPRKAIFQQENMRASKNTFQFDLFIVVAYGKIISEKVLNMPKLGSINIHYSLLPKYRGATPIESAILNGDTKTGVTIQKMAYKLDTGDILAQEQTHIGPDEKSGELRKRCIKIGGELLIKVLENPLPKGLKQDESKATFCRKIKKGDGLIDLNDDPIKNYNKFRAYFGWPSVFFFEKGKRVKITDAKLENGKFVIKKVLPEGRREIKYEDFEKN